MLAPDLTVRCGCEEEHTFAASFIQTHDPLVPIICARCKGDITDLVFPPAPTTVKDTNPKDAVGTRKAPFSTVPARPIAEIGLAMLEGARKYGRHNYRAAGIRASVYYDAAMRHLTAWWEGQDVDPDSGLSHIIKAMACLIVLRDCQVNGMVEDDRPPPLNESNWVAELNAMAGEIIDRYPDAKAPFTRDSGAPLTAEKPDVEGGWHTLDEEPAIGRKFIALYSDGSGACMLWRHDGGLIDQDGDEHSWSWPPKNIDRWAYLPDLDFWCETWAEDPMTLRLLPAEALTTEKPTAATAPKRTCWKCGIEAPEHAFGCPVAPA